MPPPRALITGITGQDGAYLADILLSEGYKVFGSARPTSSTWRLAELGIEKRITRIELDLLDFDAILSCVRAIRPNQIYNLAAQSTIEDSVREPIMAGELNGVAVMRLLEAIRMVDPTIRLAQASSSQMFGQAISAPQNEDTPFRPESPYAIAKLFAHQAIGYYRQAHGIHAISSILFNHESPLRGPEFVTRKISRGFAALTKNVGGPIALGNLEARRDWGHARDYMRGLVLALHHPPADYVLATGEAYTVSEFVRHAARSAGFEVEWDEERRVARDRRSGRVLVEINPGLFRFEHGAPPIGDASKARDVLGWRPSVKFPALVSEMVEADLRRLPAGREPAELIL